MTTNDARNLHAYVRDNCRGDYIFACCTDDSVLAAADTRDGYTLLALLRYVIDYFNAKLTKPEDRDVLRNFLQYYFTKEVEHDAH